jgi:hypothetical protein
MITELSEEQVAKFPYYTKKWIDIGLSTKECDMEKSIEAIKVAYKMVDLDPPLMFIGPVNNPYEGAVAESILKNWSEKSRSFGKPGEVCKNDIDVLNTELLAEVARICESGDKIEGLSISNQIYGNQEFWLSSYDFFEKECNLECCKKIEGLRQLSEVCGWWTPMKNIAVLQHRPLEIHRDENNQIHNLDGPSIKFRGGSMCDVYAIHGVRVTKNIIDRSFTADDISKEENVEVRRVMIELYGQEKYLLDINAQIVHSDDFGKLYKKEFPNDESLMMVEVVNSTPEPDGSYKNYFLRVDPKCYDGVDTGLKAVASTWRNEDGSLVFENAEEYDPAIQT